ncbi:hypothetical protein HMPREF0621_0432 [Pasteurella dagmatis ATCC 43325]|uniref:Uncharacterized protein n=1 Tax=Pasteurella dagmatis ATCC 43325 TaxID=667128 RepID=C9PN58_9PAST|nr:hypothetical protein HMPREF0621_0432 [Pasteurella dagmatis ATCC 43325]
MCLIEGKTTALFKLFFWLWSKKSHFFERENWSPVGAYLLQQKNRKK